MSEKAQLLAILTAADVQVALDSATRHPSYCIDGRLHALQTKIPLHPPLGNAMLLDASGSVSGFWGPCHKSSSERSQSAFA